MRKTSFEYHIHGYRYAPESFHIYKGLPGQGKTELPRRMSSVIRWGTFI